MTWTTEKPKMAGQHLWVFDDATPTIIKLYDCGEWFKPGLQGVSFHRPGVSLLTR